MKTTVLLVCMYLVLHVAIAGPLPGDIDLEFGNMGKSIVNFGSKSYGYGLASDVAGRIFIVGEAANRFAIACLLPNGSLDPSFAMLPFGVPGTRTTAVGGGAIIDRARDTLVQSDGKILVAGYFEKSINDFDFAVVRYLPDGTLDPSFDGDGVTKVTAISTSDYGQSIALQADGRIIVGGTSRNSSGADGFTLARLSTSGGIDSTFATGGRLVSPASGPVASFLGDVAVTTIGKILAVGSSITTQNGFSHMNFALARYSQRNAQTPFSLDPMFGSDDGGFININLGSHFQGANSIGQQLDKKILLAGYIQIEKNEIFNNDFVIVRLSSDGTLDGTFGVGGKVITDLGYTDETAQKVAVQADGKVVVAGICGNVSGVTPPNRNFAVTRYLTNGVLDTSFGNGGIVIVDFDGQDDTCWDLIIQKDGKIVLGGAAFQGGYYNFAATRIWAFNPLDSWRLYWFGSASSEGNFTDLGDTDKDGLANLIEYAFALDPTTDSIKQDPQLQGAGENLFYQFTPPPSISGIIYGAEWSDNLTTWQPITNTGATPQHIYNLPPAGEAKRFIRLKVTAP